MVTTDFFSDLFIGHNRIFFASVESFTLAETLTTTNETNMPLSLIFGINKLFSRMQNLRNKKLRTTFNFIISKQKIQDYY